MLPHTTHHRFVPLERLKAPKKRDCVSTGPRRGFYRRARRYAEGAGKHAALFCRCGAVLVRDTGAAEVMGRF